MELKVIRRDKTDRYTIGDFYFEDHKFCNTLEDTVRLDGFKVIHQTAIPAGRYELKLTYSNRFKQVMPQLMNVPNFEGIRIHPGNKETDTSGCILVGTQSGDTLIKSKIAYNSLMEELEKIKEPIFITVA